MIKSVCVELRTGARSEVDCDSTSNFARSHNCSMNLLVGKPLFMLSWPCRSTTMDSIMELVVVCIWLVVVGYGNGVSSVIICTSHLMDVV